MKEETYLKAKEIMDEVEHLRSLKKIEYPPEAYAVSFFTPSGKEIIANQTDIGSSGMNELMNCFVGIINDLIVKKLQILEEIK